MMFVIKGQKRCITVAFHWAQRNWVDLQVYYFKLHNTIILLKNIFNSCYMLYSQGDMQYPDTTKGNLTEISNATKAVQQKEVLC